MSMQQALLERRYADAIQALNQRDWAKAFSLASDLQPHVPGHAGVLFVIGVAALESGKIKDAFRNLLQATQLNPSRPDYAAQWARVLLMSHMQKEAIEQAERAMALEPSDPMTFNTLAVIFARANAQSRAVVAYRRAIQMVPGQPDLHFNLAVSLMATGAIREATDECEACIRLMPQYWRAHLTLAQLNRQTEGSNHVERLQMLLSSAGDQDAEAILYLNLALEKELDDLGRYLDAYRCLTAGKGAWRRRSGYSSVRDSELFTAIKETTATMPLLSSGYDTEEPIFVIGMPRTGTTLVERILSSHSTVLSAGELSSFPVAYKRASGIRSESVLDVASVRAAADMDWAALGRSYLESTRPITGALPRFIDKLPLNFQYAGFIARALPRAKIICLRRNALDTCIANFRQLFTMTSPTFDYSFDILDVGRYYLMFDDLMRHWHEVMPDRILEVDYEAIVDDQESMTRKMLAHCDLDWEDSCLHFEENAAPVSTASAVQVRSPIYRSSLGRWKRYGSELEPLRQLLVEGGVQVPP